MKKTKEPVWKTAPISCTCEVIDMTQKDKLCGKPTVKAYPAWGGGWMALCARHALKHKEASKTDDLIAKGETWE